MHLTIPGALAPEGSEERTSTARLEPGLAIRVGEQLPLSVNLTKVHVFDPQTTRAFV